MSSITSTDGEDGSLESLETSMKELGLYPYKRSQISTSSSILIQSLLKRLCVIYAESEDRDSEDMYKIICNVLYEKNFMDDSFKMIELDPLRGQLAKVLHSLMMNIKGSKLALPSLNNICYSLDVCNLWSRYYQEFIQFECLGRGAFGVVYRVKHKLDENEYAIKKIPIRASSIQSIKDCLSEAKTFSNLNHPNIVQYKVAWIELGVDNNDFVTKNRMAVSKRSRKSSTCPKHIDESHIYPELILQSEIDVTENISSSVSSNFEIVFDGSQGDSIDEIKVDDGEHEKRTAVKTLQNSKEPKHRWATLYIQMSLGESTLKEWLATRSEIRVDQVMEILKQLLEGIQHMHSKHIIHHDIKPSNIFLYYENDNLFTQLADFGLACKLQEAYHDSPLGTPLYAAPEQLNKMCTDKSDMYSLGIVLLELVVMTKTDMERVHLIYELRAGNIPNEIKEQYPKIAEMIMSLTKKNPLHRPSAGELLSKIKDEISQIALIRTLEDQIREKDELLVMKDRQLVEKDNQIARLRTIVKKFLYYILFTTKIFSKKK